MRTPIYESGLVTLYQGDAVEVLKEMEAETVHCCITSPPSRADAYPVQLTGALGATVHRFRDGSGSGRMTAFGSPRFVGGEEGKWHHAIPADPDTWDGPQAAALENRILPRACKFGEFRGADQRFTFDNRRDFKAPALANQRAQCQSVFGLRAFDSQIRQE
jgi:hypothetical protein